MAASGLYQTRRIFLPRENIRRALSAQLKLPLNACLLAELRTPLDVLLDDGRTAVRNSNHPDAGVVLFTRAGMDAYIKGVKAGEFDDLI